MAALAEGSPPGAALAEGSPSGAALAEEHARMLGAEVVVRMAAVPTAAVQVGVEVVQHQHRRWFVVEGHCVQRKAARDLRA